MFFIRGTQTHSKQGWQGSVCPLPQGTAAAPVVLRTHLHRLPPREVLPCPWSCPWWQMQSADLVLAWSASWVGCVFYKDLSVLFPSPPIAEVTPEEAKLWSRRPRAGLGSDHCLAAALELFETETDEERERGSTNSLNSDSTGCSVQRRQPNIAQQP